MNDKPFEHLVHDWPRVQYELTLAQQPKRGRVCAYKGGKGGILDPLPIVKLRVHDGDRSNKFIFSPHMFMIARLSRVDREDPTDLTDDSRLLHGNLSATNTKLRQDDNVVENASYFIYPELAVSEEGTYRLTFNLWENQVENSQRCVAVLLASITTDKFQVFLGKDFHGSDPSTPLARQFHQQGHKSIKLRSEHRAARRRTERYSPANGSFSESSSSAVPYHHHHHHRSDSQAHNYYQTPTYTYPQNYGRQNEVSQIERYPRYGHASDTLSSAYDRTSFPQPTYRAMDVVPSLSTRHDTPYRDHGRFRLTGEAQGPVASAQDAVPRQVSPRTMEPDGNPFPSYSNEMNYRNDQSSLLDKFNCII